MANSARIDELEKKFSENARRYFAPLANEYRKAGDLDRAIEICRAHLPQQPGHMSGHVVYGQALYESRQLEEAKTVFEAALALDPENLIALRHLGDIARDSGDPATARTWYLRVLDADPRNDEVAGMLAEIDAAAQGTAPAAAAPPPAESASVGWGDINPERTPGGTPVTPPPSASAEEAATAGRGGAAGDAGAGDESEDVEAPEAASSAASDTETRRGATSDPASGSRPPTPRTPAPDAALFEQPARAPQGESLDRMLNDAFASEADTAEMEAPRGSSASEPPPRRSSVELDEETFAEVDALFDEISPPRPTGASRAVTGSQPTQPPARAGAPPTGSETGDALFGDDAKAEENKDAGAAIPGLETAEFISPSRQPPAAPRRDTGSMAVAGLTSFDQPTDEDSSTRAAFVTETMAELYLQQGFIAEALDIYRQLLAQNPDDASLRDRVDQLERGGRTSLSVAAVSSEVIEAAKQRHATRPIRTVRSFFGRLAGRRPPQSHRGDEGNGEPSAAFTDTEESAPPDQPAAEPDTAATVRLDLVGGLFGDAPVDEADERAASTLSAAFASGSPEPAPRAATRATPTPTSSGGQGGRAAHAGGSELSLDQVFREPAARGPRKSGTYSFDQFFSDGTPEAGGAAHPGEASAQESAEAPEGDLEQFTAWLEGLKRK